MRSIERDLAAKCTVYKVLNAIFAFGRDDGPVVIASQRVGARRRPMIGSAKQSRGNAQKAGLLRRFAPRNDETHHHLGSSYPTADSISIARCTAGRAIMRA